MIQQGFHPFFAENVGQFHDQRVRFHPGGKVSDIQLSIEGASRLSIGDDGELRIEAETGLLRFMKPAAYQEVNGKRVEISAGYRFVANQPETYGSVVWRVR